MKLLEFEQAIDSAQLMELPDLIGTLATLQSRAYLRMAIGHRSATLTPPPVQAEKYLTVEQVCERFAVSPKWLYRHKKQAPHSQPSRKKLLFPEKGIERWFATRK